jgi:hypothetical protein
LYGSRGAITGTTAIIDYGNFNYAAGTAADNSVKFNVICNSAIRWLHGGKDLIIGTATEEIVGNGSQGIITQTDYNFKKETKWGSNPVQPVEAGRKILFVSGAGNHVRTFGDNTDRYNGYDGEELSFWSHDLVKNLSHDIDFADDPNYLVVCLMTDGSLVLCTYVYDDEGMDKGTQAWTLVNVTNDGIHHAMCVTAGAFGAKLWSIVVRGSTATLEQMDTSATVPVFMDSCYYSPLPVGNSVTGLTWLAGVTVSVVTWDPTTKIYTIWPDGLVSAGGVLQVPLAAMGIVVIGYNYTMRGVLLKQENTQRYGSSQAQKQRWPNIVARIHDSLLPLINGERAEDRAAAGTYDLALPLLTGDVSATGLDWDDDGTIVIEQDLPGRTEIQAVFGDVMGTDI